MCNFIWKLIVKNGSNRDFDNIKILDMEDIEVKIEMTPEEYKRSIGYGKMLEGLISSLIESITTQTDIDEDGEYEVVQEILLNKYVLLKMIQDKRKDVDYMDNNVGIRFKE